MFSLKGIKELPLFAKLTVIFFLYPFISFDWYRFCKEKGDIDKKKFAGYGILGIIGIAGLAISLIMPMPQKKIIAILAIIPYGFGSFKQTRLITHKYNDARKKGKNAIASW